MKHEPIAEGLLGRLRLSNQAYEEESNLTDPFSPILWASESSRVLMVVNRKDYPAITIVNLSATLKQSPTISMALCMKVEHILGHVAAVRPVQVLLVRHGRVEKHRLPLTVPRLDRLFAVCSRTGSMSVFSDSSSPYLSW